jgi:spore maturation protein CgeB
MFSRRLVEILACGGIAVTTPAQSVDRLFAPYCHVVRSEDEARELFARLKRGPSADDLARAEAGARHVQQHHTWAHRLAEIRRVVGV